MNKFLEDSIIEKLIQQMFAHIKMQVEKPQMAESGFTADQIMHLYKIFHKLWLTQGNSYIKDSKKEGSDKLKK